MWVGQSTQPCPQAFGETLVDPQVHSARPGSTFKEKGGWGKGGSEGERNINSNREMKKEYKKKATSIDRESTGSRPSDHEQSEEQGEYGQEQDWKKERKLYLVLS